MKSTAVNLIAIIALLGQALLAAVPPAAAQARPRQRTEPARLSPALPKHATEARQPAADPPAVPQAAGVADVALEAAGFQPPVLTVTLGTQIRWTNNTATSYTMQTGTPGTDPGSGPNTVYLPLVIKSGVGGAETEIISSSTGDTFSTNLGPGDIFRHTFVTTGTHPYYASSFSGQVVVQTPSQLTLFHIGDQTIPLGSQLTINLMAFDPQGDPVTFATQPFPLPANMSLDAATGQFTFAPAQDQVGTFQITFRASDDQGETATETINIDVSGPGGSTGLQGRILDANEAALGNTVPLSGATVTNIENGLSTTTDAQGNFTLTGLTPGLNHFDYDATTVAPANSYGGYRSKMTVITDVVHVIDRPIYIMKLDNSSMTPVDPNSTTTVSNPGLGIDMTIPPHTVVDDFGSEYSGMISISEVPRGFTPGSLPDTMDPGMVVTIQPMGLTFNQPAPITFPNRDGFLPDTEVNLWSMDHDTGQFFVAGIGQVSSDGSVINTIQGGIREASWHFPLPQPPEQNDDGPPEEADTDNQGHPGQCQTSAASMVTMRDGTITTDFFLPAYVSQGEARSLNFVYSSKNADPHKVIPFDVTVSPGLGWPRMLRTNLTVGGVEQGGPIHIDTDSLQTDTAETVRVAVNFDAGSLDTGVYPYTIRGSGYTWNGEKCFPISPPVCPGPTTVSADRSGELMVVNGQSSPFGAGWGLAGLQRLYPQSNNDALLTEGDGSAQLFRLRGNQAAELFPAPAVVDTGHPGGFGTNGTLARGDLNNDGLVDLVTLSLSDGTISILLGDGAGSFSPGAELVLTDTVSAAALDDFNGDNNLDLVVAHGPGYNSGGWQAAIFLGDGSGSFNGPTNFPVGYHLFQVKTADFNNDTIKDLVFQPNQGRVFYVLSGDGNGGFGAPVVNNSGAGYWDFDIADFNGDQLMDLALGRDNGVDIFLGDGSGNFSNSSTIHYPNDAGDVTAADLNNDAAPDLAVLKRGYPIEVYIYLNDGSGSFLTPDIISTDFGWAWGNVIANDLNNDDNPDLVVLDITDGLFIVLLGNGSGSFTKAGSYATYTNPTAAVVDDFDQDGRDDLAFKHSGEGLISIYPGDGSGTFAAAAVYPRQRAFVLARSQTVGDFNGDNHLDVALASGDFGGGYIDVMLGDGTGGVTFSSRINNNNLSQPYGITAADFDGDGILDLAATQGYNGSNVIILIGDGGGGFSAGNIYPVGAFPFDVVAADFDGNGTMDVATANQNGNNVSILLGDGAGGFAPAVNIGVGSNPRALATGDFNGDNVPDLAVPNNIGGTLSILLGDGSGGFANSATLATGQAPSGVVVGDWNNDGSIDLAVANRIGNDVSIFLGDGSGGFGSAANFGGLSAPEHIAAGDWNNDGSLDLALGRQSPGRLYVMLGDGAGGFGAPASFPAGDSIYSMSAADLDEDGTPDLITADRYQPVVVHIPSPPGGLITPPGEHSVLTQNSSGTYTRRYKDGALVHFNAAGLQTAWVDRNGNRTSYGYDGSSRLTSITDPTGRVTSLSYSGGLLSSVTGPAGRTTSFQHDGAGNLTQVTFPDDSSQSFAYDGRHLMTGETNRRGLSKSREFDWLGRIFRATFPDSSQRQMSNAQSVGAVDLSGGQGTFENPAPVQRPTDARSSLTDGEGRTTTFETGRFGEATRIVDPAGLATTISRDQDGNATQIDYPSGLSLLQSFDSNGNLTQQTDQGVGGTRRFTYDSTFNQITSLRDPQGQTTSFSYDGQGNLTQLTTPLGRTATVAYNGQGLPTSLTDPLGTAASFSYDANGNVTAVTQGSGPAQRQTSFSYTAAGYLSSRTDALGQTTTYSYDALGRLTGQTRPDGQVISYAYDANGNITAITPPGKPAHTFGYNVMDQLATYDPPPVGGAAQTGYSYNQAEQLTQLARPDGQTISYSYDSAGRLDLVAIPRGQIDYSYHSTTGNLIGVDAPDGVSLSYQYSGGRLNNTSWSGPVAGSVGRSYDSSARIAALTVNSGSPVSYQYDADDAPIQAGSLALAYAAQSGLLSGAGLNSLTDTYTYNSFSELLTYQAAYGGAPLYDVQYSRDKLGRIAAKTETIGGATTVYSYSYDPAGRLTQVQQNGSSLAAYSYDANGNRLSDGAASATYDDQDRLLTYGAASYSYTANGELLSKTSGGQTTGYSYDALGNLTNVTLPGGSQIEYLIDGNNRRVGKKVNGTPVQGFLYQDDLNPIAELDGSNALVSLFVYGSRANVPDYMVKGGVTYRLIADHLGSVRLVVDSQSGAIAQRLDYDAFGRVTQDTNPGFQPFGFAGGLYDPDTGLVRFGARDYDAEVGRWTAKDPSLFAGGLNLYRYVNDDPVNFIDMDGKRVLIPTVQPRGPTPPPRPTEPSLGPVGKAIEHAAEKIKKQTDLEKAIEKVLQSRPRPCPVPQIDFLKKKDENFCKVPPPPPTCGPSIGPTPGASNSAPSPTKQEPKPSNNSGSSAVS